VRAAFVGGFAVGHAASHGDLVRDGCGVLEAFVEDRAFDFRLNVGHVPAIFDRGVRFGVPAFLVGHTTGHVDVDDRFRLRGLLRGRLSGTRLHLEEIAESQADSADHADLEKCPPTERRPEALLFVGHDQPPIGNGMPLEFSPEQNLEDTFVSVVPECEHFSESRSILTDVLIVRAARRVRRGYTIFYTHVCASGQQRAEHR
jgi:hypothetical protein